MVSGCMLTKVRFAHLPLFGRYRVPRHAWWQRQSDYVG
jgi:hypothetical protein